MAHKSPSLIRCALQKGVRVDELSGVSAEEVETARAQYERIGRRVGLLPDKPSEVDLDRVKFAALLSAAAAEVLTTDVSVEEVLERINGGVNVPEVVVPAHEALAENEGVSPEVKEGMTRLREAFDFSEAVFQALERSLQDYHEVIERCRAEGWAVPLDMMAVVRSWVATACDYDLEAEALAHRLAILRTHIHSHLVDQDTFLRHLGSVRLLMERFKQLVESCDQGLRVVTEHVSIRTDQWERRTMLWADSAEGMVVRPLVLRTNGEMVFPGEYL